MASEEPRGETQVPTLHNFRVERRDDRRRSSMSRDSWVHARSVKFDNQGLHFGLWSQSAPNLMKAGTADSKNECPCRCCSATQDPCGLEAALVFLAALTDGDLHCSFYFNSYDQRTLTHDLTWCEAFVAPFSVDPIAAMCLLSASA